MENKDISWLHLSDFHVGKDGYAQNQIHRHILTEVKKLIDASEKPDFIFITGDIANRGRHEEYEIFDKEFFSPLMQQLGDDYLSRVFMIPGNHDVDRKESKSVKRYDVLVEIPTFLDPNKEGLSERDLLLKRFRAFDEYPWYLENTKWVSSSDGFLAKRIKIKKYEVGVLCINTAWFCGGEGDCTKLTPGVGMVENGLQALAGCSPVFVLGHHPLDWLMLTDATRIKAMLIQHKAIYLHGHLHKTGHLVQTNGITPLVAIQSGCVFASRSEDIYVTRFLQCSYEMANQTIHAQPKKWRQDFNDWVLDSDAFPNSLRAKHGDYWTIQTKFATGNQAESTIVKNTSADEQIQAPEGWVLLDENFFIERTRPVTEEKILQYFEGRVPQWEDILDGNIPARLIVQDLITVINQGLEARTVKLTLLLGAGGEGKTTAFLQTLAAISKLHSVNVLWRFNPEQGLPISFVKKIAQSSKVWLIATDEGDSLIEDIYQSLRALYDSTNVHFFIACRDIDWIDSGGNGCDWSLLATYAERRMKGLEELDARIILNAWSKYGARGLGKLSGLNMEVAVSKLLDAARLEASTSDGAFLGAMLRVRVGVALKDHVSALMARLESREIQGVPGKTFLDVFAYIAIPHALNILFLSKSVLARAIGIEETRVRRRILGPLGEEAAAAAAGHHILTRHRAIAEAAMEIAENRYDIDREDILCELVRAAIVANDEAALVPNLKEWRYLSTRMFDEGNQSLGVKLAITALNADSRNSFLAVKLAQLYRLAGQAEQSVRVFRDSKSADKWNRAYYTEWAACEGFIGNAALGACLNAFSIADITEMRAPEVKDVGFALAGSLAGFIALYQRYQNLIYLKAAAAADSLARRITLPISAFEVFEEQNQWLIDNKAYNYLDTNNMLGQLVDGFNRAYQHREVDLPKVIHMPSDLGFEGLRDICRIK